MVVIALDYNVMENILEEKYNVLVVRYQNYHEQSYELSEIYCVIIYVWWYNMAYYYSDLNRMLFSFILCITEQLV